MGWQTALEPLTLFAVIPAQFLAAGSFGAFHATTFDFDNGNKKTFLDRTGFDGASPNDCLWRLRPNSADVAEQARAMALSARLAVASHAYGRAAVEGRVSYRASLRTPLLYTCSQSPCDQVDFARIWSRRIRPYNYDGNGYTFGFQAKGVPFDSTLGSIAGKAFTEFNVR